MTNALSGQPAAAKPVAAKTPDAQSARAIAQDSIRAIQLVRAYRVIGHLEADLDPLKITRHQPHPQLDPAFYGFSEADMDRPIFIGGVMGMETATPAPDHRYLEAHLLRSHRL